MTTEERLGRLRELRNRIHDMSRTRYKDQEPRVRPDGTVDDSPIRDVADNFVGYADNALAQAIRELELQGETA